ncbi:MAG TPA: hypothetical protein VLC92_13300 [Rhodocyclaceae bacterium]|nr:hypothetical protein [Rhodocyclaceae bacterium]
MKNPGMLPGQRLPRDRRCLAAIHLLLARNADKTAHAHERSLLTHLTGTTRLLLLWDAPIDTVRAGLCHSIYGTNAFRTASLARHERALLQQTIGRRAEALVWSFSTLRRPATLLRALRRDATLVRERSGRTHRIELTALQQLFMLECANLLDQGLSLPRTQQLLRQALRCPGTPKTMLDTLSAQLRQTRLARCWETLRPASPQP